MSSAPHDTTTHGAIAQTMIRTLASCDLSSEQLFQEAGLDSAAFSSPDERVLGAAMQRVWRAAVTQTGDDAFGIRFAQQFHPGSIHGLGFAWAASDTLADAFDRLVRYFRVLCTFGEVIVDEQDQQVRLWLNMPVPAGTAADASLDGAMAMFIQLCRYTKGHDFNPARVELQRPEPENQAAFNDFFRAEVRYGSAENVLFFNKEDLAQPLPMANPELARANDSVVISYLQRFDKNNILSQLRAAIIESLPSGTPSQGQFAEMLHMSIRSFQRRLAKENIKFSEFVEQIREDLARQYLRTGEKSISEVSYLLGYSEPGNFSRSFKRWTGETPQQYQGNLS
ncbi:MAG: AraC family transcriptional regulator [Pseudomonadota bacterium]